MLRAAAFVSAAVVGGLVVRARKANAASAPRRVGERALPHFWTYTVDMTMHEENRQRLVQRMQAAGHGAAPGSMMVFKGGDTGYEYCSDREPIFRQESFFQFLFGVKEPGCWGAVDPASGKSILFVPRLGLDYEIWCGKVLSNEHWQRHYGVTEVRFVDEIAEVLAAQGVTKIYRLKGVNTDSGSETKTTADFEGLDQFADVDDDAVHPELVECRVVKSDKELDLLRYVTRISSAAHCEVMRQVMPGMFEFQLESIFRHECYFRGGARNLAYTCICGAGDSGATLHYGHAGAPNERLIGDDDLMLLDMGCEFHCYASDITCAYPANGVFSADQRFLYEAVLAAHDAVFEAMGPGVEWVDMHRLSHRVLGEKLLAGGLLQGDLDELLDNHVTALFYPHGLGHLIGLDAHDTGGYPKGAERIDEPGTRCLRMNRTLLENMTVTIEPGCYFIDRLLDDALANPQQARFINQEVLQRFRNTGGVRIESDVIVTATGAENMTKVPRLVEDVEAVLAGASWEESQQ